MADSRIRSIRIDGNVAYVPLTRGYEAIIDADDVGLIEHWNWAACIREHRVYASRATKSAGRSTTILLHRVVARAPRGLQVDHISGDCLDNRKANLRLATASENGCNRGRNTNNRSGFKGVWRNKAAGKWQALITSCGRRKYLGLFDSPEAAHEAYRKASTEMHGNFSRAD